MTISRIFLRAGRLPGRQLSRSVRPRWFCEEAATVQAETEDVPKQPVHGFLPPEPQQGETSYEKKFPERPFGINIDKQKNDGLWVADSAWRDVPAGCRFLKVEWFENGEVKKLDIPPFPYGMKVLKEVKTPCTIIFAVQDAEKSTLADEEDSDDEFWASLETSEQVNEAGEIETVKDRRWWAKGHEKPWLNQDTLNNEEKPLIPLEQEKAELTRFLTAIGLEEHIDRFHSMTQLVLCKTYDLMILEIPIQHRRKIMRAVKHWLQYQNVVKYGALPYMNADGSRSYSPSVGQHHGEIQYERQFDITPDTPAPKHLQFVWFPPEYPELDWYPPEYRPFWVVPIAPTTHTRY